MIHHIDGETHPGKATWMMWLQVALHRHGIRGELHGRILDEVKRMAKFVKWKYCDKEMSMSEESGESLKPRDELRNVDARMDPEQERHLNRIKEEFCNLASTKYRKGQAEHGGNLFEQSTENLLDRAIDEAIDQVVYLVTMKQKMRGVYK